MFNEPNNASLSWRGQQSRVALLDKHWGGGEITGMKIYSWNKMCPHFILFSHIFKKQHTLPHLYFRQIFFSDKIFFHGNIPSPCYQDSHLPCPSCCTPSPHRGKKSSAKPLMDPPVVPPLLYFPQIFFGQGEGYNRGGGHGVGPGD